MKNDAGENKIHNLFPIKIEVTDIFILMSLIPPEIAMNATVHDFRLSSSLILSVVSANSTLGGRQAAIAKLMIIKLLFLSSHYEVLNFLTPEDLPEETKQNYRN